MFREMINNGIVGSCVVVSVEAMRVIMQVANESNRKLEERRR